MMRFNAIWNNIKEYKLNSILVKNFLVISLVLMIPLGGFSFIYFQKMTRIIEEEITSINMTSLEHFKDVTEGVFYDMDQMSLLFSLDKNVRLFFNADNLEPLLLRQYEDMFHLVDSLTMIYEYVDSVYFYAEKTDYILGRDGGILKTFRDKQWHDIYKEKNSLPSPWLMGRLKYDIYPYLITLIRPIYSSDRKTRLGSVLINIDIEEFRNFSRNEKEGNFDRIYIANSEGKVLMSDLRSDLFTSLYDLSWFHPGASEDRESYLTKLNGQESIVSCLAGQSYDLTYVSVLPLVSYKSKMEEVINYFLLILGLCLITSLIFSVIITVRSFQPIYKIITLLEHPLLVSGGIGKKSSKEVQLIADNIFKLISSNHELQNSLGERLSQLNKARVTALQSQINPHFLYNTLETIRWLTVELTGEENRPSAMISTLSRLLRLSLDTQEEFITLEQEIDHGKNYLDLMMVRYEEKMNVSWQIDQNILSCQTIKLILQPVLENAIYHGIKPLKKKGLIEIKGEISQDTVILTVSDNGPGMKKESIDELNRRLKTNLDLVDHHIGISNVNQRIKLLMGRQYGLSLKARSRGLTVEIRLPVRKEKNPKGIQHRKA